MDITIKEIPFGSDEQKESVALRYRILREPLGLQFEINDLGREYEDYHIAAFEGERILGILLLKPTANKYSMKMRQVAVEKDYQGKGIGKTMIKFSEEFAKNKGFERMELHARESAIAFYLSLNYSVEGDLFLEVNIPHKKMFKLLW